MSETKRITLYAAIDSPFPHRVRLALEEAGAAYDIIWINLIYDKPEWYEQKVNVGVGKVPYLVYGGPKLNPGDAPSPDTVQIPESLVINEFLADIFPDAHLLPADPGLRAKARLFAQYIDTKFLPAFAGFLFGLGTPVEGLLAVMEGLQRMLPAEGFAVGEWSIADAAAMPLLMRLNRILELGSPTIKEGAAAQVIQALSSPRFARIQKYVADNTARPSMARTWDQAKFKSRIERLMKTGKVNSDITIPIPVQP
ncbi:thioredoxin-like protein [Cerioporus squamosus]|nr:thioredoxin-like protein [Cerioporus squamosus]